MFIWEVFGVFHICCKQGCLVFREETLDVARSVAAHDLMMDGAAEVPASLLRWVTPDENASEFFRRQGREAMATGLPFIDQHIKLRPGHILELAGPAGSAKTEMLIQMLAHMLCSSMNAHSEQDQEHVVLVDCDGKFDTVRLLQVLEFRVSGATAAVLPRFHLVRCFNTLELLLALNALPRQLAALKGRCRLLLLDNIAANVWHDRAAVFSATNQHLPYTLQQHWPGATQQQHQQQWPPQQHQWPPQQQQQQQHSGYNPAGGPGTGREAPSPGFDALRVQKAVAVLLHAISQQWRIPVVVTKQTGVHQVERSGTAKLVQREILTEPLQTAVSHRLVLMPAGSQPYQLEGQPPQLGAVVQLQWQAGDYTGPLQRCLIRSVGLQVF